MSDQEKIKAVVADKSVQEELRNLEAAARVTRTAAVDMPTRKEAIWLITSGSEPKAMDQALDAAMSAQGLSGNDIKKQIKGDIDAQAKADMAKQPVASAEEVEMIKGLAAKRGYTAQAVYVPPLQTPNGPDKGRQLSGNS